MIPIRQAFRHIDRQPVSVRAEKSALADSVGRVLAEDVAADSDLPPFDRSQMDGYAVKAADTADPPVTLTVVGESAAGRGWHSTLKKGEAVRIMTGAPVPPGADAVQKVELTSEENGTVTIFEPVKKGRSIIKKGAEVKLGRTVLKKGTVLLPGNISIPAAFGYARIRVAKSPRIAILSTGTEIVDIAKKPKRDQIRNSNSLMLEALCRSVGASPTVYPMIGDELAALKLRFAEAVASADILVTTGGVSVGKYDLTKLALEELGAEIFFDKVALKPGKPAVFGRLKKAFVFGLPGNPVSAAVTFHLFVRRMIRRMQGAGETSLPKGSAVLTARMKGTKERDSYLPVSLSYTPDGHQTASPLSWHGSSDFVGFAAANALAIVPRGRSCDPGEAVDVVHLK